MFLSQMIATLLKPELPKMAVDIGQDVLSNSLPQVRHY